MRSIPWIFGLIFFLYPCLLPAQDTSLVERWKTQVARYQGAGDKYRESQYSDKLAYYYWNEKNLSEAASFFEHSLRIYKVLQDTAAQAIHYKNLGLIVSESGQSTEAITYLEKSLALYASIDDKSNQASVLIDLAKLLNQVGRQEEAMQHLEKSLTSINDINDIQLRRKYYGAVAQTYQLLGDSERSMEYFMYYMSVDNELQERASRLIQAKAQLAEEQVLKKKQELAATIEELQKAQEVTSKQRSAISQLSAEKALKEMALNEKEARLKNETWVRRLLTGGVALSLLTLSLMVVYSRQTKKKNILLAQKNDSIREQKEEIEDQKEELMQQSSRLEATHKELTKTNRKVMHSINYAQRIQGAMLPEETDLQDLIADSFVLFQPRDIVSGDFYWFTETYERKLDNQLAFNGPRQRASSLPNKIVVAAVDCTGHGVPGAFMSMIGFNFLNDIGQKNIYEPNEILNTLHLSVRRFLKQDATNNKDGMDVAICTIDHEQKVLEFAGANNPIVYMQEGEMHVIKGDKSAVGGSGTDRNHRFIKHTISIEKETQVYLFSDGYQDQFGGEQNRKFMSKKLRELLFDIHQHPAPQQKEILQTTLADWKGDRPQVDDILVMGFKVGGH